MITLFEERHSAVSDIMGTKHERGFHSDLIEHLANGLK